jgi:RNA recognition motif-containing protein
MNIYVGNLAYEVTEDELKTAFQAHGTVESARVIMDRNTGRSKGFAFVEMSNSEEAKAAIEALNGTEMSGRSITVNEARPKPQPGDSRGGGGGSRGGFGGGSRGGDRGGDRGGERRRF